MPALAGYPCRENSGFRSTCYPEFCSDDKLGSVRQEEGCCLGFAGLTTFEMLHLFAKLYPFMVRLLKY